MTLKDFEIILTENNIRPCDFWDNIDHVEWNNVLTLISVATSKTQLKHLLEAYYL